MANIASFPLSFIIVGDGISLSSTVVLASSPTSVSLVSSNDVHGADKSSNVSSVVVSGSSIVLTFTSVFTGIISVQVTVTGSLYSNFQLGIVSMGNSIGKTNVLKTATLTTTAVTADQVVLTYTVTAGKTFYLEYIHASAKLTNLPGSANPIALGILSLESPAGTKLWTAPFIGPPFDSDRLPFGEPIPFAAGTVIRMVTTPAAATSTQWFGNFGGYEK